MPLAGDTADPRCFWSAETCHRFPAVTCVCEGRISETCNVHNFSFWNCASQSNPLLESAVKPAHSKAPQADRALVRKRSRGCGSGRRHVRIQKSRNSSLREDEGNRGSAVCELEKKAFQYPTSREGRSLSSPRAKRGNALSENVSATVKSSGPIRFSRKRTVTAAVQLRRSR